MGLLLAALLLLFFSSSAAFLAPWLLRPGFPYQLLRPPASCFPPRARRCALVRGHSLPPTISFPQPYSGSNPLPVSIFVFPDVPSPIASFQPPFFLFPSFSFFFILSRIFFNFGPKASFSLSKSCTSFLELSLSRSRSTLRLSMFSWAILFSSALLSSHFLSFHSQASICLLISSFKTLASSSPSICNFATAAAVVGFFFVDYAIALDAQVNVAEFKDFALTVGIVAAVVGEQSSLSSVQTVYESWRIRTRNPQHRGIIFTHTRNSLIDNSSSN